MDLTTDLNGVSYDDKTDRFTLPLVLSGSYYRAMIGAGAPLMGSVQLRALGDMNTIVLKAVDGEVEEPAPRLDPPEPTLPEPQPGIAEPPPGLPVSEPSSEVENQEPPRAAPSAPAHMDAVPAAMDATPPPQAYEREDNDQMDAVPTGESVRDKMPKQSVESMLASGVVAVTDVGMPQRKQ
jgi:hypothetical protein